MRLALELYRCSTMSYSDLLAQQEKELERLNQDYYADHVTIKTLQNEHYDKTRYDGQLKRLQELHERKIKELQTRFTQEQREYLGEPTPPAPMPDISQSQDKAAGMIKDYQQQRAKPDTASQQDTGSQQMQKPQAARGNSVDEAEVKKLAQEAREKREEKNKQRQRGFRR